MQADKSKRYEKLSFLGEGQVKKKFIHLTFYSDYNDA